MVHAREMVKINKMVDWIPDSDVLDSGRPELLAELKTQNVGFKVLSGMRTNPSRKIKGAGK